MACKIRQDNNIEGVEIEGLHKKLSQYADDLWTAMKHKASCYQALFKIMNNFEHISGLKVNYNKTEILRIGSLKDSDAKYVSQLPIKWSDGPIKILGLKVVADTTKMLEINYREIMEKVNCVCKIWAKRQLSLLGKILIVNTLIVPLFVYRLQVLPNLTENMLKEYQRCIVSFLWDEKKAKIAYDVLCKPYQAGGLNLVDLKIKDYALKAKWAQHVKLSLATNSLWDNLAKYIVQIENRHVWELNLSRKDIIKTFPNSFWRAIFYSWNFFHAHSPTSKGKVMDQFIWYNSNIKEKGKTMYFVLWYKAGITHIRDLVTPEGVFLTCINLKEKYGNCFNIISYTRLLKAIPKEWKTLLKRPGADDTQTYIEDVIGKEVKCSNLLYKRYCSNKPVNSKARQKWENRLGIEIPDKKWSEHYQSTKRLTVCTKLRFFQYRLSNNYLITNSRLQYWKKDIPVSCTHGCQSPETVLHCLYHCKYAQKIWNALERWLKYFCFIDFQAQEDIVIFNSYKDSFPDLVNTMILITKQYLYAKRCLAEKPCFIQLMSKISLYRELELLMVKGTKSSKKIEYKWSIYDKV